MHLCNKVFSGLRWVIQTMTQSWRTSIIKCSVAWGGSSRPWHSHDAPHLYKNTGLDSLYLPGEHRTDTVCACLENTGLIQSVPAWRTQDWYSLYLPGEHRIDTVSTCLENTGLIQSVPAWTTQDTVYTCLKNTGLIQSVPAWRTQDRYSLYLPGEHRTDTVCTCPENTRLIQSAHPWRTQDSYSFICLENMAFS